MPPSIVSSRRTSSERYKRIAEDKGFLLVASSPLTRSSHHAGEDFAALKPRAKPRSALAAAPAMHVFETKHRVAHSADDMFALVARIEDYPKFLPLCEALAVKCREQSGSREVLIATMTVGYRLIRESFTTRVDARQRSAHHPRGISRRAVRSSRKSLALQPVTPKRRARSSFYIAYSFRSRLFERLVGGLFDKAVHKYTEAFEARADAVYGRDNASASPHSNELRSAERALDALAPDLSAPEIAEQHHSRG